MKIRERRRRRSTVSPPLPPGNKQYGRVGRGRDAGNRIRQHGRARGRPRSEPCDLGFVGDSQGEKGEEEGEERITGNYGIGKAEGR